MKLAIAVYIRGSGKEATYEALHYIYTSFYKCIEMI